jgi:peptide deformylase
MELELYPSPVLRKRCATVREVNDDVYSRAHEMLQFMYEKEGLGLAASQVGWPARVVAIDAAGEKKGTRIFVNPKIVSREGEMESEEGCLSLPGLWVPLVRAAKVKVAAYTIDGEPLELEAEGVLSRAWQHEMDHINGVLIIDRLQPTALLEIRAKLKELERSYRSAQEPLRKASRRRPRRRS